MLFFSLAEQLKLKGIRSQITKNTFSYLHIVIWNHPDNTGVMLWCFQVPNVQGLQLLINIIIVLIWLFCFLFKKRNSIYKMF